MSKENTELSEDIWTLENLLPLAGQVVKYSRDGGKSWRFAKLWRNSQNFLDGSFGLAIDEQISLEGVPSRNSITNKDFSERGYIVRPATPEEYKNIQFSYANLNF